jgi:hypothetical protein
MNKIDFKVKSGVTYKIHRGRIFSQAGNEQGTRYKGQLL